MPKRFDPVLVEVMKNELTAIAEEMGITMKRTARSIGARETAAAAGSAQLASK